MHLLQARRADIELFARDLEARGRARATITRRLCTVAGFYPVRRRGRTAWAFACACAGPRRVLSEAGQDGAQVTGANCI